jgi:hypothetical protein
MSNVSVKIVVRTSASSKVLIVGNVPALGGWDPSKAVELKKEQDGSFSVSKMLPTGQIVEFKILCDKSWDKVEKGVYNEEIKNHIISPEKGLVAEYDVARFNK